MKKHRWIISAVITVCAAGLAILSYERKDAEKADQSANLSAQLERPARIVSLAPNLTEILFALGLGDNVVGISSDSDFPPETIGKAKVGTFWQPNIEAIIAAKPDLVVTERFEQHKAVADTLTRLGYKSLILKINKISELDTAIRQIGVAASCPQQAEQLINDIDSRLNELKTRLGSVDKVKVLWVVQAEPLRVVGRNTFVNELIELAGGKNAIGPTIQQYPPIGAEEIIVCGAEVIIQSAMQKSKIAEEQKAAKLFWSKWTNVPAVNNDKIYVVEPDIVLRLGPRLPQGLEMVGRCLHPEIFAEGRDAR